MEDIYIDQFLMTVNNYGVVMTLMKSGPPVAKSEGGPAETVAVLRMSLEHAKAMAQIMRQQLKQFEEQVLKTEIPLLKPPRSEPPPATADTIG